jgi:hypothetical protein
LYRTAFLLSFNSLIKKWVTYMGVTYLLGYG